MPNATEFFQSADRVAAHVRRLFPYARKLATKAGNREWIRTLAEERWANITVRLVLSVALLFSIYLVTARAVAIWYFREGTPEGIASA